MTAPSEPSSTRLTIEAMPRGRRWLIRINDADRLLSKANLQLLLELVVTLRERSHHVLFAAMSISLEQCDQPRRVFLRLNEQLDYVGIVERGGGWACLRVNPVNVSIAPGVFELPDHVVDERIMAKLRRYYGPPPNGAL